MAIDLNHINNSISGNLTLKGSINNEKPVYDKPINLGSGSEIDCSLGRHFYRSVSSGTVTFTFTNIESIPSDSLFRCTLEITYSGGTVNLPTATWVNETISPIFTATNTYVILFYTRDSGSTWFAGGV